MLKAFRIKWRSPRRKIYLGSPEYINLPPEVILKLGLKEPSFIFKYEENESLFRVNGKVYRGIAVGEEEFELEKFVRARLTDSQNSQRNGCKIRAGNSYFTDHFVINRSIYHLQYGRKEYILEKADFIVIIGWASEKGKLFPLMCGATKNPDYFFYLSGVTEDGAYFKLVNSLKYLPQPLLQNLRKHPYRVFSNYIRVYRRRVRDEQSPQYVDVLPNPPYTGVAAVKLIPPEQLSRVRPSNIPGDLHDVFVLRTFLYQPEGIPVKKVTPSQLRKLAEHIHGDIFDPAVKNENAIYEYQQIYENSCGYLLFCIPDLR